MLAAALRLRHMYQPSPSWPWYNYYIMTFTLPLCKEQLAKSQYKTYTAETTTGLWRGLVNLSSRYGNTLQHPKHLYDAIIMDYIGVDLGVVHYGFYYLSIVCNFCSKWTDCRGTSRIVLCLQHYKMELKTKRNDHITFQ